MNIKKIFIAANLFFIFFAIYLLSNAPTTTGKMQFVSHEQGYAYFYKMIYEPKNLCEYLFYSIKPGFDESQLSIWQNGQKLPYSKSLHDDIRKIGDGRFSHWGEVVHISTIDNVDISESVKFTYKINLSTSLFFKILFSFQITLFLIFILILFYINTYQSGFATHLKIFFYSGIIVVLIIIGTAFYVYYGKPFYTPAEYWISDMYLKKDLRAKKLKKEKIIIAAGSNCLFGISSKVLENELNKDIINLGMHASLPLSFHIIKINQYAKKGDIVVLPLEYLQYYDRKSTFPWLSSQFSTWGQAYLPDLPNNLILQIIARAIPDYFFRVIASRTTLPTLTQLEIESLPMTTMISKAGYSIQYSNNYAEFLVDATPTAQIVQDFEKGSNYLSTDHFYVDFFEQLQNLTYSLQDKGIKLFVTFPATVKNHAFDMDIESTQQSLQTLLDTLDRYEIPVLGNPHLYNFPIEYFYDSGHHLNAHGAILRSLFLADDIQKAIQGKLVTLEAPSKDYIQSKKEEATRILEEFRNEATPQQ